jgi:glycine oxidase
VTADHADVAVVGGGVIGLGIAWRAARAGLGVTLIDPEPRGGASWAAAGMLAPVTEVVYGEEALLGLNLHAVRRWPEFAAELAEATGHDLGFHTSGTLLVALDADDNAALDPVYAYQTELGLAARRLRGREARELEPLLTPGVRGAVLAEGDHRVDPRAVTEALVEAACASGVTFLDRRAMAIATDAGRATGVHLDDGSPVGAGHVVLAAGCWSGGVEGLPAGVVPPVRPVKGQIVTVRDPAGRRVMERTVRGMVRGRTVYLVPRDDGRVVIGATVEEQGFDTRVTAGGVSRLLRDGAALIPAIEELDLVETRAGLRPGSPDNVPLIGESALPGLAVATGHYRNGMLLAPATAEAITALLTGGDVPDWARAADPARFAGDRGVRS